MNTISKVIRSALIVFAFVLASCGDFHGPWDYYPEERDVYLGVYTYGYVMSGSGPHICFSKVYELDEVMAEDFAFYDSAHVTVEGRFGSTYRDEEVDTTVVLYVSSDDPNCFENSKYRGIVGESYTMEAVFKWDSSGHTARSKYKAVATIPDSVRAKGVNVPKQDGSYKWIEYKSGETVEVEFLEFPMDMEFIKCAMDYDHSARGVISVLNYGIDNGESQETTINKMFKGLTEEDSTGYRGIAMHDPLERSQTLGFTVNSRVGSYYALDTLYLMNMMLPLGYISVDFYATDAAYIDYEQKVKESVSDSRVVPESNIEKGMGVFFGMAKSTVNLYVKGEGVSLGHIAWRNCQNEEGDNSDSWDSKGCRLFQDVACSGWDPIDESLSYDWEALNQRAYEKYRDTVANRNLETCYASNVKAAMMLDTTKWSIFLPDSIDAEDKAEAYGDGLKRYCVASNFESNHIADCAEMYDQCIESPEKNDCKEYLWIWCADRNWDTSRYPQCKSALVSRYYIETPKSSILQREVESICSYYWEDETNDKNKKKTTYHWNARSCNNWCKINDKGAVKCQ